MQSIPSICPNCKTHYNISVAQLRIAEGNVCCFKCSHTFNAYTCMDQSQIQQYRHRKTLQLASPNTSKKITSPILAIFQYKTHSSNIDLQTYLNTPQHDNKLTNNLLILTPITARDLKKKSNYSLILITVLLIITILILILVGLTYALIGIG